MKFSYTGVSECASELSQSLSKITELVGEMRSSCQTLQKGVWEGEAADYYCNKFTNSLNGYAGINMQFMQCINSINKSLENYKAVDSFVVSGGSGGSGLSEMNRPSSKVSVSMHV